MANGFTNDDCMRAVFLSVIGPKAYQLLSNLLAPAKPGKKSYDDLVKTMSEHHDPPPSEIMQCFKVQTQMRVLGESIAVYVAALRTLGQTCWFGDSLEDITKPANMWSEQR